MKTDLIQQLAARLAEKQFPFAHNRFALNIQTDNGHIISVSTKDGVSAVGTEAIEGATTLHITGELLARALRGDADLQALYLNRYIQVDGSVMDVMNLRDALETSEVSMFRAAV